MEGGWGIKLQGKQKRKKETWRVVSYGTFYLLEHSSTVQHVRKGRRVSSGGRLHDRSGGGRVILCQRLVNSPDTDIDSIFDGGMEMFPYCLVHNLSCFNVLC